MKLMGIAVGLFALLMFVGVSYAAKAPKGDVVTGKITAVDTDKGTVTIKTKTDEVVVKTDKDTAISIDGVKVDSTDKDKAPVGKLEVGMNAKVSPATGTASKIDAMTKKPKAK